MHNEEVSSELIGTWHVNAYEGDIVLDGEGGITNRLLHHLEGENIFVNNGKGLLLDRLFALGTPPGQVNACGVGTDSTTATVSQTQLNPAIGGSVWLQPFDSTPTRSAQTVTCTTTYGTGFANFTWNEMALFNGTVNGTSTMLDRLVLSGLTKTSSMSVQVIVTITQS